MKMISMFVFLIIFIVSQGNVLGQWYKIYEDALNNIENCKWEVAITQLQNLTMQKTKPNLHEPTYGVYYEEYIPYFYLGKAYFLSGQYNKALENFQHSENYNAIKSSPAKYPLLLSFKDASQKLIFLDTKKRSVKFNINEQDSILITLLQNKQYNRAITFLQELSWFKSSQIIQKRDTIFTYNNDFNQALEAYLTGNYKVALIKFIQLSEHDPQNQLFSKWIKKIRAELELLQVEEKIPVKQNEVVIEKIITQTVAPIFAVQSPGTDVVEVRSDKITISGIVADDEGIDHIEMTINGAIFTDQANIPLKLKPSQEHEQQKFPFKVKIPLQMGKNQVTLIAFDIDSIQHSEIFPLTVIRKLPIYKTSVFYMILISLIITGCGIIVLSKFIKYRIAIVNKYNPYIAGAPILHEEMFFGREPLLKSILNTLHHNSLMIYGPRRIGKTSIQHQLKRKLENANDPEYNYVPVYIDLQGVPEDNFFSSMIEDILEGCKNNLENELELQFYKNRSDYDGRNFSGDLKHIITQLRKMSTKKLRLVLLMDEVDELNRYSDRINQRLRSIFMKTYAENLVAVMSGTHIRKKWESEGSPWYNFFEEIEIPRLKQDDAVALIKEPVKGIFKYDDAAVDRIIKYSECYPYQIQKYCVYAINRIIEKRRRKVTVADVEAISKYVVG